MLELKNYRTVSHQTDFECFNDGFDAVVIEWDGEANSFHTFTRGTDGSLYDGFNMEWARKSLSLSFDEWDELLQSEVEYLEIA